MSKDLGKSTSYAYYVAEGGTKTPQEYGEMLVNIDTVATRAEDAADSAAESATGALNSKNAAQTAATTATTKASEATTAATTATTKAGEASTSASTATSAKDTAVSASQTATSKATEATTAAATATSAKTDAVAANTAAQSAKTAAQTAQTGAETAAASVQSSAAQIAQNTSDISELKEDLTQVGVRTPIYTVTHGKAMTTQTTSLVDSSMFSIADPIALNKGERISVTCSTFATTFGIIAVCNADNTSRQIIVTSDGNDNTRYHYTAKDDCYVCLLLHDSDTSPNVIIDGRIPERVDVVETSLEYDETFIKDLLSFEDIPLTIDVGSFYNSNVVYTAYANNDFQTAELTIDGGKYYHIHASCSYGNTIYAFLDSNNVVIEKVLDTTGTATGTVVDVAVKAPINATTLRVGTFKGSGTLSVGIADGVAGAKTYSGITWAVFGDSLTEVNATAAKKYYDWLSGKYGMSIVNYGASGSGYRSSYDDGKAFYQRMANIDPAAFDFLTIFGSGNDIKYLKNGTFPLGTANDYGNLNADPTTLGSAINRTIEQYHTLCPTKPIGLITPTPWFAYCTGWRMNRDDAVLMQNYSDLIKEIGYIRGIPVLDLFNCSNLRPWDATNRTVYYNENGVQDGGTHPNSAGHKLIASQFDTFIHSIYFAE